MIQIALASVAWLAYPLVKEWALDEEEESSVPKRKKAKKVASLMCWPFEVLPTEVRDWEMLCTDCCIKIQRSIRHEFETKHSKGS